MCLEVRNIGSFGKAVVYETQCNIATPMISAQQTRNIKIILLVRTDMYRYPMELEIPQRIMSPALQHEANKKGPLKYRLFTVGERERE